MGNIKSGRTTHKRRWYDKHKGLSSALEKLRTDDEVHKLAGSLIGKL